MKPLELIGIIVAVESFFKALEYFINKITANHDKNKQIDDNSESLSEYIEKTDKRLEDFDDRIKAAHNYALDSLTNLEKNITNKLDQHRSDYMEEIKNVNKRLNEVDDSIIDMKATYQSTVAIVDIKIDSLEKAQNKHNNLIERMYKVENAQDLHTEQIKEHARRLNELTGNN